MLCGGIKMYCSLSSCVKGFNLQSLKLFHSMAIEGKKLQAPYKFSPVPFTDATSPNNKP